MANTFAALPFQKQTVWLAERKFHGRCVIANDMGLGKTVTSLWFVKRKKLGETFPFLVVCPKIVRQQWAAAIKDTLGFQPDILSSRTPPGSNGHKIQGAIIHQDIIAWWRDWIENQDFQTFIIDECQNYTNPKAKRTRTVVALMKQIPFVLPMSGTPLTNRPIELYPIINATNPKYWHNRNAYAHKFCGPKWTRFGWDFRGASNIGELNARLKASCMVRFRKEEVEHQLPDKIRTIIPVELSNPEEYIQAKNDFIGWMAKRFPERLNKAVKAAALVQSGHLLRLAARLKLRSVVEWINTRIESSDEKIVIAAVHRKCVAALARRINCKNVVVNGAVTGHKRDLALHQFKNDKHTKAMILNIQAAGIGLNLVEANTLCVVELPQKPGPLLQVEDRIHRFGQIKTAWIYYFIGIDTIEELVSKVIQRKQRVITGTLDGAEVETDFELYDMILEELERELTGIDGRAGNKILPGRPASPR